MNNIGVKITVPTQFAEAVGKALSQIIGLAPRIVRGIGNSSTAVLYYLQIRDPDKLAGDLENACMRAQLPCNASIKTF